MENFVKPDCLNVYVSMPCPLKVPFKQVFEPFLAEWNSDAEKKPIYIPTDPGCSSSEMDQLMLTSETEDALPDVFVSPSYKILFSEEFNDRFLKTGIYTGLPREMYGDNYPENILNAAEKYNVGFLAFSSWGFIHDTRYNGENPMPSTWEELTEDKYKDLISIHGCHGQAGNISMLMNLEQAGGKEALVKLADNISKVRHFSQLIKEIGSNKGTSTPFYIMPTVAAANIPSTKKAELLNIKESIVIPLFIIVKRSKMEESCELLKYFTGDAFRKLLSAHAYFQPEEFDGIETHTFEHMETFRNETYQKVYNELNHVFIDALGDKIPMNGVLH